MINISHKMCSLHTSCKNCWASQLARWSRRSLLTAPPCTRGETGALPSPASPWSPAAHWPAEVSATLSPADGFCGPVHTPAVTLLVPGRQAGRKRLLGAVCAGWFPLNVPHFPGRTKHFAEQNADWVSPQQRGMTIVGRVGKQELGRRQIRQ